MVSSIMAISRFLPARKVFIKINRKKARNNP
jgi:hypothetical protein